MNVSTASPAQRAIDELRGTITGRIAVPSHEVEQERVGRPLASDAGLLAVPGQHDHVVGERQHLGREAAQHRRMVATGQVRPADRAREEQVAGEHHLADRRAGDPVLLARSLRGHWAIEALHRIRDVSFGEDRSQVRSGNGPNVMVALRILVITALRLAGITNIAKVLRHHFP